MLDKLEDNHLLAVAMVSHMYYHPDPMSLITSAQPQDGVVNLPFWVNTRNGVIACTRQIESSLLMVRTPMVRLPDVEVPILKIAQNVDMTMPSGRSEFVFSVLRHIIHAQWSAEIDMNELGLCAESLATIRKNLSQPMASHRGIQCASSVLNNVILPVLVEGRDSNTQFH